MLRHKVAFVKAARRPAGGMTIDTSAPGGQPGERAGSPPAPA